MKMPSRRPLQELCDERNDHSPKQASHARPGQYGKGKFRREKMDGLIGSKKTISTRPMLANPRIVELKAARKRLNVVRKRARVHELEREFNDAKESYVDELSEAAGIALDKVLEEQRETVEDGSSKLAALVEEYRLKNATALLIPLADETIIQETTKSSSGASLQRTFRLSDRVAEFEKQVASETARLDALKREYEGCIARIRKFAPELHIEKAESGSFVKRLAALQVEIEALGVDELEEMKLEVKGDDDKIKKMVKLLMD